MDISGRKIGVTKCDNSVTCTSVIWINSENGVFISVDMSSDLFDIFYWRDNENIYNL